MDVSLIKLDLSIFLFSNSMFLTKTAEKHVIHKKYIRINIKIIVFCILKLMNSQNKYVNANSLKNHKQNCTGGFIPPHLVTFSWDCPVCVFGPIFFKTHGNVSKEHNFLTNKVRHP